MKYLVCGIFLLFLAPRAALANENCASIKTQSQFLLQLHNAKLRSLFLTELRKQKVSSSTIAIEPEEFKKIMTSVAGKDGETMRPNNFYKVNLKDASLSSKEPQLAIWVHKDLPDAQVWKAHVYFRHFFKLAQEAQFTFENSARVIISDVYLTNFGLGPHFNKFAGEGGSIVFEKSYVVKHNPHHASIYAHEWGHWLMSSQNFDLRDLANNLKIDVDNLIMVDEFLADIVSLAYTHQEHISILRDFENNTVLQFSVFGVEKLSLPPWTSFSGSAEGLRELKKIGVHGLSMYLTQIAAKKIKDLPNSVEKLKVIKSWVEQIKKELRWDLIHNSNISDLSSKEMKQAQENVIAIFENPYSTINKIRQILTE